MAICNLPVRLDKENSRGSPYKVLAVLAPWIHGALDPPRVEPRNKGVLSASNGEATADDAHHARHALFYVQAPFRSHTTYLCLQDDGYYGKGIGDFR